MSGTVLIVGAGPVGLTLASELARYGVSVRIVDRAAQRTDKSKALVLWSRTLELLDRGGGADAFVAAGHRVDALNLLTGERRIGRIELGGIDSPYPFGLMLPQSETERLLEERLAGLGVRVERQVELLGLDDDGATVTATLRHVDGREETVGTAWLVGCDGAHSTVRHRVGLAFEGKTLRSDWVLADIHMSGMRTPDSELATYWHEDGILAIFPISPGRYRIVADTGHSDEAHPADPTMEEVQSIVDRRGPGGIVVSDPVWLSAFRINERKVAEYRTGRVFLAGDAAHVHSPAGGQGMNTGMQDAFNLSWKLALACRGGSEPNWLLDSYSAERSAVGAQVLADTGRLTAVGTVTSPALQLARNLMGSIIFGLAPVRRKLADTLAEVSVGYRQSPLNVAGTHARGGPEPGERAPPKAGQVPVGAGGAPRFALFAARSGAVERLIGDYSDVLEPEVRPPFAEGMVTLVRPDGYTACTQADGNEHVMAEYLARFRCRSELSHTEVRTSVAERSSSSGRLGR